LPAAVNLAISPDRAFVHRSSSLNVFDDNGVLKPSADNRFSS
jgi:hypothetical protein